MFHLYRYMGMNQFFSFLPINRSNHCFLDVKQAQEILYYQWIPFLLVVKAFIFYIRRMSWNIFGSRSGIQLSDLVEVSFDCKFPTTDAAHRQLCRSYVVDSIDQYCYDHRRQPDARQKVSIFLRSRSTTLLSDDYSLTLIHLFFSACVNKRGVELNSRSHTER